MTKHIVSCEACQRVLMLYEGEARFIKETLREPSLPAYFVDDVLREVKPYNEWKWLRFICVVFLVIFFTVLLLYADVVN